jgi:hypothetical protein
MPRVINRDLTRCPFAREQTKFPPVPTAMERFGMPCSSCPGMGNRTRQHHYSELPSHLRVSHRWKQTPSYGPGITGIGQHHGVLHCPGILAYDKPLKAVVTIVAASRVGCVHWFTLYEESKLVGQYTGFIIGPELEAKVGFCFQLRAIVVDDALVSRHGFKEVPVKAGDASLRTVPIFLPEIVLDDAFEIGGDVVLQLRSEGALSLP